MRTYLRNEDMTVQQASIAEHLLPCDHADNNVILCNVNVMKLSWLNSHRLLTTGCFFCSFNKNGPCYVLGDPAEKMEEM